MLEEGRMAAFSLPRNAPLLSHLCFADDLVIFTRGLRPSIRGMLDFFRAYELASGQKANMAKSSFFISKHATSRQIRWLKGITGISPGKLPFQYLGNWLYQGRRRGAYFQHLVDKFTARLTGWKGRLLSSGGRLLSFS